MALICNLTCKDASLFCIGVYVIVYIFFVYSCHEVNRHGYRTCNSIIFDLTDNEIYFCPAFASKYQLKCCRSGPLECVTVQFLPIAESHILRAVEDH